MKTYRTIGFLVCLLIGAQGLLAQEMSPKKYENAQWYNIVHIDYLPGKYNTARSIISDYFMKASDKAGTPGPVMVIELNSGPYDIMALWHLKDGIESLNWETSPDDIKWRSALNELAGSSEKADGILKNYQSCIASSTNSIGRLR